MKRALSVLFVLLVVASMALTGCQATPPAATAPAAAPAADSAAPAAAAEMTAVIGFTASQTGKYNVESTRQLNGLNLWISQVNAAGGVALADGSMVKFDTKFYDDESNTDRVQELYTRLATEDNADFLISPYSSGLTDASSVIAEQYGKVMITTGAASDSTYMKGYTLVFQAYTPASRYLTGAADLLAATDDSVKKIAVVYENSKFSTDVATALNDYATAQGYEIVLFEGYDAGTSDFAPFINKIQDAAPDAIMGGGHFQDGSTFVKQLYEKNVPVKYVALLVAPPEPTFSELGDAALGVVGPSQWEPLVTFSAESAGDMEFFGPSSAEFTASYMAAYNEEPSYHAAGGFAAGLLLQKAIESAGTLETQAVKDALDAVDMLTFFGNLKFNVTPDAHGLQIGHSMVYIQWQQDDAGTLGKQVVWPPAGATAPILYPMR